MLQILNGKRLSLLIAVTALIALVITGCAPAASAANPSQAGSVPTNTISVSGLGEAFGQPDQATIMLGINISNANVGDAVEQSNEVMNAVIAALVEAGVAREDIQTVNFSVWPEDRYDPNTGTPTGERTYRVDSTVQVTVRDLSKVGSVIDTGLSAGANSVQGLSFSIADQGALESEARTKALEDAREKAQQIAAAMGVTLGDPIIVSEGGASGVPVYYGLDAASGRGAGGAGEVPISPGQQAVNVQLYVTFAIK